MAPAKIGMHLKQLYVGACVLLVAGAASASPPAHDLDEGPDLAWKVGVGCALATIAASGLVAAVAHEPVDKLVAPLGPAVSAAITPSTIAVVTAGLGAAVAVALVVAAEASDERPAPQTPRRRQPRRGAGSRQRITRAGRRRSPAPRSRRGGVSGRDPADVPR